MLKVFSRIATICRNFGQNHGPKMQMVYFRSTYVAQKRLFLSSLLKQTDQLKQHLLTKNSYKCKFIKLRIKTNIVLFTSRAAKGYVDPRNKSYRIKN